MESASRFRRTLILLPESSSNPVKLEYFMIIAMISGFAGTVRHSGISSDMIILMKKDQKPNEYAETIGRRLKSLRESGNMKQSAMAAIIGKKSSSVSSYELGECLPPVDVLKKYAEQFDVDMNYLMGYTRKGVSHSEYCTDKELALLVFYRLQSEDRKGLIDETVDAGLEKRGRRTPAARQTGAEHRGLVNEHRKPYDPHR